VVFLAHQRQLVPVDAEIVDHGPYLGLAGRHLGKRVAMVVLRAGADGNVQDVHLAAAVLDFLDQPATPQDFVVRVHGHDQQPLPAQELGAKAVVVSRVDHTYSPSHRGSLGLVGPTTTEHRPQSAGQNLEVDHR
jgi:hypothetical protein